MEKENTPFPIIREWIEEEKKLSPANPQRIVLATAGKDGFPHSRVVAIREISLQGIIFFTQKGTRKVVELTENPKASMTLWLPQQQRQVLLEGSVFALTDEENESYWNKLPREQQLRFFTYAPTSGKTIPSPLFLDEQQKVLEKKFVNNPIPMSPFYCGFHLIADKIFFYTLNPQTFSEVHKYERSQKGWQKQLLSP